MVTATEIDVESQASLKQLQALEKDFKTLDEQIQRIETILQTHKRLGSELRENGVGGLQEPIRFSGRHDYALRWTLNKLRSTDVDGRLARSNPNSWNLLRTLLAALPAAATARTLDSLKLLTSVESTLKENFSPNFSTNEKQSGSTGPTLANGEEPTGVKSSKRKNSNVVIEQQSKHKKRKISETSSIPIPEVGDHKGHIDEALFISLSRCLHDVVNLSMKEDTNETTTAASHVESFLKTDCNQAATLLGLWLQALIRMKSQVRSVPDSEWIFSITSFVRIWEVRSLQVQDVSDTSNAAFSRHCLLPCSIYLAEVNSRAGKNTHHSEDPFSHDIVSVLQQLIARHIFVPGRASFHGSQRSQIPPVSDEESAASSSLLSSFLAPLRNHVPINADEQENWAGSIARICTTLFDVGVRCTPLATTRAKSLEASWLEHLLKALSNCMGLDISEQHPSPNIPSACFEGLADMLRTVHSCKVAVSARLLSNVIYNDPGLEVGNTKSPSWELVAQVISLGPNVFVDGVSDGVSGDAICDLVMSAINTSVWKQKESLPSTGQSADDNVVYNLVKLRILVPLIKAFASARSLSIFLDLWHKNLSHCILQQLQGEAEEVVARISIWEDDDLVSALSEFMEVSLTNGQITLLLSKFGRILQSGLSSKPKKLANSIASGTLQRIILCTLRRDDTISNLHAIILQTQKDCETLLQTKTRETRHWPVFWKLLTVSQVLNIPTLDSKTIESQSIQTFRDLSDASLQCMTAAIRTSTPHATEAGVHALAWLGSFLSALKLRNIGFELLLTYTSPFIELLSGFFHRRKEHTESEKAVAFASTLSRFPVLLDVNLTSNQSETGDSLAADIFKLAREVSMTLHENSPKTPVLPHFWRSLLSHALTAKNGLREDIFKYLTTLTSVMDSMSPAEENAFVGDTYSQFPNVSVPRKSREHCLDAALNAITHKSAFSEASRYLALIANLVDLPHGNARLSIDTEALWNLAKLLDTHAQWPSVKYLYFTAISRSVLGHHQHNLDSERSQTYLAKFRAQTIKTLKKTATRLPAGCKLQLLRLGLQTLMFASKDDHEQVEEVKILEAKLISQLCSAIGGSSSSEDVEGYLTALKSIHGETLLTKGGDQLEAALKSARQTLTIKDNASLSDDNIPSCEMLVFSVDAKIRSARGELPNTAFVVSKLDSRVSAPDSRSLRETFSSDGLNLSTRQRCDLINHLLKTSIKPTLGTWRLIYLLVEGLAGHEGETGASDLVGCAGSLCERLATTTSIQAFKVISDTIAILLRSKSRVFTQSTIESLLATLVVLTSTSAPALPQNYARIIYTRLLTLTGLLLSTHRRAIRARFDTLMLLLANLLRCLFTPDIRSASHRYRLPVTPWQSSLYRLTDSHASAYARILTFLCDPSLSTVRTRGTIANQGLVDETRRARRYAGQYVPYLLQELCRCVLQGKIAPSTRRALMPGIWSVFEVIEKETLEACFATVSAPGRVVVRGLWEDWRREGGGKWRGG